MLPPKVEEAINKHINAECYSAYLYYSMEAYFASVNLKGAAHWMEVQVQEELLHVKKMVDYLNDRRGRVILKAVEQPPTEWGSMLEVFQAALAHEQAVTEKINDLVALAREEKDNATYNMLQWFVDEQVEEEASVDAVIQQLKMVEGFSAGLYMIDRELGQRTLASSTSSNM